MMSERGQDVEGAWRRRAVSLEARHLLAGRREHRACALVPLFGLLGLDALPGVKLYGPPPGQPRTPTVAFTLEGRPARDVSAHLSDRHGVFLSHGHFYAANITEDLGVEGLVRAGCACYTTSEEIDRLVQGVSELV